MKQNFNVATQAAILRLHAKPEQVRPVLYSTPCPPGRRTQIAFISATFWYLRFPFLFTMSGVLHWITHVDSHPAAVITGSSVVSGDIVYVGVSSIEESLATDPTYRCCSFRGSVVALEANTGQVLWKQYMLPDNPGSVNGYSGNAVWQPTAIDLRRGWLYIGTGNNYEVPDSVKACINSSTTGNQPACFAPDDYFDTAMALDLFTGQIKWSRRLQGVDIWTAACIKNPNPMACPEPSSPDYDLGGSGPNLLRNLVGLGQKSGICRRTFAG
jgi:polyvinyl alcohol dehydrogenase (cytochrome)